MEQEVEQSLSDLLYIHATRGCLQRATPGIIRDSAGAIVAVPTWEIEGAKDASWVQDLRCMTLIDTPIPSDERLFVDAQGRPLPPPAKGWSTTVAYPDGSLAHPDRDMGMSSISEQVQDGKCVVMDCLDRSIARIIALPERYGEETADGWYCPPKMAQNALASNEWDVVVWYMSDAMHLGTPSKENTWSRNWWQDPALRTGRHTKNEFAASVLEKWAGQDELAGTNPPTWGDRPRIYRPRRSHHQPQPAAPTAQNFEHGDMTRKSDGQEPWVPNSGALEPCHAKVNSVLNVPKAGQKAMMRNRKLKAKMLLMENIFANVLSGKPTANLPLRGAFGGVCVPLKQGCKAQRHREFQMRGEREKAMTKS